MFFNKANNVDEDDDNESGRKKFNFDLNKFKGKSSIIVGAVSIFLIIIGIIILSVNNVDYYLVINGADNITIYLNHEYSELGYSAYDSKSNDLTDRVVVKSNLDTNKVGNYQISYSIGNITKIRYVSVIEGGKTDIKLNGNETVYLLKGSDYTEEGYQAIDTVDGDITSKVITNNNININKNGRYSVTYFTTNSAGVYAFAVRKIVVYDINIKLSLANTKVTASTDIIVSVKDSYFDYLLLPNNNKVNDKSYKYKVNDNGKYKFVVYDKNGFTKEASITVSNIDKGITSASCSGSFKNEKTVLNVSAEASSGINRYVVNGVSYVYPKITIMGDYNSTVNVTVYDNSGNSKDISCKVTNDNTGPTISSISNDGIFVSIKTSRNGYTISGYYFSYTNQRPSKSGGYLATSLDSLEVARLPGTTYVWVEDTQGNISQAAKINIGTDVIKNSGSILKGQALSDYISSKGGNIDDFNKLMARSVRAAGLYTKTGAATAGVFLATGLYQKYGITIPYWRGGKTSSIGAYGSWGIYNNNPTYSGYYYYGMDCDGFVNWTYLNTGIVYNSILANSYYHWNGLPVSKENGEVGDVMRTTGHVKIIVGKTDKGFIVAEEAGRDNGLIVSVHAYTWTGDYIIIKGEELIKQYTHMDDNGYPSGF